MMKNLFVPFRRCFLLASDDDDEDADAVEISARVSAFAIFRIPNNRPKAPISRLGGNNFILRQGTDLKDQCGLALVRLEGDQEIIEEDAVCEICFNAFKVNEEMVKMKCRCRKEELVHQACATKSNCGLCEQQVEKIHLILLQLPTDAGVTTHNNWKKKLKWFSKFKW